MSPRSPAQVVRLGSKCLSYGSHLAVPTRSYRFDQFIQVVRFAARFEAHMGKAGLLSNLLGWNEGRGERRRKKQRVVI